MGRALLKDPKALRPERSRQPHTQLTHVKALPHTARPPQRVGGCNASESDGLNFSSCIRQIKLRMY